MKWQWLFYFSVSCMSFFVGGVLKNIVYALPPILQRKWEHECRLFLSLPAAETALPKLQKLNFLEISPLKISCMILTPLIIWHFGLNSHMWLALLFTWTLLVLAGIDWHEKILPDQITLPLLWLGLLINLAGIFCSEQAAVLGAAIGYISLWTVAEIFYRLSRKVVLGRGDFKLFAAIGAWLGWQQLILIIFLASIIGIIVEISRSVLMEKKREILIPFGPYLALGGWIGLLWGQEIILQYLHLSGL